MSEQWRPVVGREGYYEVSSLGRVRSLSRPIRHALGGTRSHQGRVLKPGKNGRGYFYVQLSVDGAKKVVVVQKLVAEAFLSKPESAVPLMICHNNGDGYDNRVSNLRWDTQSSNMYDKTIHGTDFYRQKTQCPRGHSLTGLNIEQAQARLGRRSCKACGNARSHMRYHKIPASELQPISDSYYAKIMGAAA